MYLLNTLFFVISLTILILHSCIYRGLRATFNFFIFGFLWISLIIGTVISAFHITLKLNEGIPSSFVFATNTSFILSIGLLTVFYISWHLSEKIISRFLIFNKRLFPILAFLSLALIYILPFCIEIVKTDIKMWHPKINIPVFGSSLFSEYAFFISRYFLFFINNLLIAFLVFFLIEYSRYRDSVWKSIFIFLLFIHFWIVRFLPAKVLSELSIITLFFCAIIILLAIFNPLPFEYEKFNCKKINLKRNSLVENFLDKMPLFILFFLVSMVSIDALFIKKWLFILSDIPLILLMLLSIRRFPIFFVYILTLFLIIFWRIKSIFIVTPVFIFILLQICERLISRNSVTSK